MILLLIGIHYENFLKEGNFYGKQRIRSSLYWKW